MNTFKFRAECEQDLIELLNRIAGRYKTLKVERPDDHLPDIEVEIMTSMGFADLNWCMRMVQDGHVMQQTLALKEEYTGERRY